MRLRLKREFCWRYEGDDQDDGGGKDKDQNTRGGLKCLVEESR